MLLGDGKMILVRRRKKVREGGVEEMGGGNGRKHYTLIRGGR